MTTAMFEAFAKLPGSVLQTRLGHMIYKVASRQAKRQYGQQDRGWHANLSYRTYRELVAQGVMV